MWARSQTSGDMIGETCATNCSSSTGPMSRSVASRARLSDAASSRFVGVSCCTPLVVRSSLGSERERRGRNPRRTARALEDECDLVDIAPAPILAGFDRADDRVRCRVMVRSRMTIRGIVAAADVPTGEADPEVQPLAAVAQALLAAVDGRRKLA